jgi:hypothetical protein
MKSGADAASMEERRDIPVKKDGRRGTFQQSYRGERAGVPSAGQPLRNDALKKLEQFRSSVKRST